MNADYLKTIIQFAKDELQIRIKDGLTVNTMVDPAHVMMSRITTERPISIGCDKDLIIDDRLIKSIKVDKKSVYSFYAKNDKICLKNDAGLDLIVGKEDYYNEPKMPVIEQSVYFGIDYKPLYDAVDTCKKMSDHLLFIYDAGVLSVIIGDGINGENAQYRQDIKVSYMSGFDQKCAAMFPMDYVRRILKENVAKSYIKMGLSTCYPVSFEYALSDDEYGIVGIYTLLAPRIDDTC